MRVAGAGLSAETRRLLMVSALVALSIALSNVFVNVFLWKVDRRWTALGWYNLTLYAAMPGAFLAASRLAQVRGVTRALQTGVLLHVLFYGLVFAGGRAAARVPGALGALLGVAGGFYWFGFHIIGLVSIDSERRDRFYGLNGLASAVAGMVAPPLAGALVQSEDRLGGLTGYHVLFGVSLALFVLAAAVSWRIPPHHLPAVPWRRVWGHGWRQHPAWRSTLWGCSVYGLREGVFVFLIGLLMYVATGSELRVGEFLLLQGVLSALSYTAVSRWVRPANRLMVLGLGAVGMALTACLFWLPLTPRTLWGYGAGAAASLPLFLAPLQSVVVDTAAGMAHSRVHEVAGHVVVREAFENAGRVAGVGVFLAVAALQPSVRAITVLAACLGFVQLGSFALLWRARRQNSSRLPTAA
ncbi:MAG: MFS transporter [Alicyclobacillus sp.]|nr:MFS transporter [Alicyclobacillus sp.]